MTTNVTYLAPNQFEGWADEASKAGADLLDQEYPEWCKAIDTSTLDMAHAQRCILGQRFGDYFAGLEELGIYEEEDDAPSGPIALGFNVPDIDDDEFSDDDHRYNDVHLWDTLRSAWLARMNERGCTQ